MTPAAVLDGARLAALREVGVLDTDPEPEFDRFTRLTATLLGAPVALVSLVDRDRQFFKSARGLTGDWADARQTPLSHSVCQYVVAARQALVVGDTRLDPLVADNLAVRDLAVIAYAGVPLILDDGHTVGALCAIDTRPRAWAPSDVQILTDLAAAVQTLMDLRRSVARKTLHDMLTGLPTRALVVAHADQLRGRVGGEMLALALGVDEMGAINETYGAAQGDRVLTLIARRIGHQLSDGDILGRVDGDSFIVLRPHVSDQLEAIELANRVRGAVGAEPIGVRGDRLSVSITVGLATAGDSVDITTLLARAEEALRLAKRRRDRVTVATSSTAVVSAAQRRLRSALIGAVAREEVSVAFQPIVELATGQTRGFEALARWQHPELGTVSPGDFVPVAELSGEIVAIGEHVLRTACRQLVRWRERSGAELELTVNFSPVQLAVANIADIVAAALRDSGLPGRALALEITEGVFLSPGALERRNLHRIRVLGVRIALDDFGTGYSALSYLKRLPVDVIKVDRSFLDGLETNRRDAALMRAILSIGSGMDLEVVAEGVETNAQRELLHRSGCLLAQGFLFAPPLPADEVELVGAADGVATPA